MVKWHVTSAGTNEEDWDRDLKSFSDYNIYQTFAWGEYKRLFGWVPQRWVAVDDDGRKVALFQALLRAYPGGIGLVWSPGGPAGDISAWGRELQDVIRETLKLRQVYCRFFSQRSYIVNDALALRAQGWNRSSCTINSGLSMLLDLTKDEEQLNAEMSKNWRHNLRRADKTNLSITEWINPDIDSMIKVYQTMQDYKGLGEQWSREQLIALFEKLGKQLIVYRCENDQGELLGFRACAVLDSKAWDMLAATTIEGRKVYSSYAILWALILHCRTQYIKEYDLSGIDPETNKGVYDFKKGTGALPLEFLGEWEWAPSKLMQWAANWAIARKGGGM